MGGKKTKTKWEVGNNNKCTDSHCGPNYTFIVEISSQLLSDKTFLAKGQQLIAVIKPPFDFICSDGTKHDRRASDRQSDLPLILLLPPPWLLHERKEAFKCVHSSLPGCEGVFVCVKTVWSRRSTLSFVLSIKLNSPSDGQLSDCCCFFWFLFCFVLLCVNNVVLYYLGLYVLFYHFYLCNT